MVLLGLVINKNISFNIISSKLANICLLESWYFTLGSYPFMANFFYYYYKASSKKRNLQKDRIFSNTFRFSDGLCTSNNDEFVSNYWSDLWVILLVSCLIKEMSFSFLWIAYPIWIAIYHLKYFMLLSAWKSAYYQDNNRLD